MPQIPWTPKLRTQFCRLSMLQTSANFSFATNLLDENNVKWAIEKVKTVPPGHYRADLQPHEMLDCYVLWRDKNFKTVQEESLP